MKINLINPWQGVSSKPEGSPLASSPIQFSAFGVPGVPEIQREEPFSVLSWNIANTAEKGKLKRIADVIFEKQPDFIALQEVNDEGTFERLKSYLNNLGDQAKPNKIEYQGKYIDAKKVFDCVSKAHFHKGLATFYKLSNRLTNISFKKITIQPNTKNTLHRGEIIKSFFLMLNARFNNKPFSLFNVHLLSQISRWKKPLETAEFRDYLNKKKEKNPHLVIAGDFNLDPKNDNANYEALVSDFTHFVKPEGYTFKNKDNKKSRLDYIMGSSDYFEPVSSELGQLEPELSDHRYILGVAKVIPAEIAKTA